MGNHTKENRKKIDKYLNSRDAGFDSVVTFRHHP